jgi:hypothetical protein
MINPQIISLAGELYEQNILGQMVRIDLIGRSIPRVRMSKKEKLKLRKELHKINEMDSHELANKIVESVNFVPVINPKSDEQLKQEQVGLEND